MQCGPEDQREQEPRRANLEGGAPGVEEGDPARGGCDCSQMPPPGATSALLLESAAKSRERGSFPQPSQQRSHPLDLITALVCVRTASQD